MKMTMNIKVSMFYPSTLDHEYTKVLINPGFSQVPQPTPPNLGAGRPMALEGVGESDSSG